MATVLSRQVDGLVQSHMGTQRPGSLGLTADAVRSTACHQKSKRKALCHFSKPNVRKAVTEAPEAHRQGTASPTGKAARAWAQVSRRLVRDGPERAGAMAAFSARSDVATALPAKSRRTWP